MDPIPPTTPTNVGATPLKEATAANAAASSPGAITPAPKPLSPEEKKAKRALMLKNLSRVGAGVYILALIGIFAWAFGVGQNELTLFKYLPIAQSAWSGFLMKVFNVLLGIPVGLAFLTAVFGFIKSLLTKKEDIEKKKKASRMALWGGLSFFGLTVLWLLGIWLLGPRLIADTTYRSPIKTTPAEVLNLTSPIEITFDASSIPVDPDVYKILSYSWNFGDGQTGNGMTLTHTYTHKAPGDGLYTVTLTVKYMDLKTGKQFEDKYTTQVGIANEQTAASFTATPSSGEAPLKVHFDATASYDPDGEIVAYDWDLNGDNVYDDAQGEEVDWQFDQDGDTIVSLRVTDNSGEWSTSSQTISVGSVEGLRAVISSDASGDEPHYIDTTYSFDGALSQTENGKIIKYTWNFGDGSKGAQSRSTSHAFSEVGTYTVVLTVEDQNGNKDTAQLEVTVTEEGATPTASFTTLPTATSGTISGPVPLKIDFDATGSTDPDDDIVDYEWDFDGDGTIDDLGDTVSHTYQESGDYTATLTTTDSVGNKDEASVNVSVGEQGIVASLTIDQDSGEVPLTVHFDASGSTYKEGRIVSYEYNFGDGSAPYSTGSSVSYKYNSVGSYTASVTAIGDDGSKDTATVQIVVRPVGLTACFTVNTTSGKAPLFVSVDPSCSTGTVETYQWDFGDGFISFDHKPDTHSYATPGTYTLSLEITSPEGIVSNFKNTITVN